MHCSCSWTKKEEKKGGRYKSKKNSSLYQFHSSSSSFFDVRLFEGNWLVGCGAAAAIGVGSRAGPLFVESGIMTGVVGLSVGSSSSSSDTFDDDGIGGGESVEDGRFRGERLGVVSTGDGDRADAID
jgi:hypothetical protein